MDNNSRDCFFRQKPVSYCVLGRWQSGQLHHAVDVTPLWLRGFESLSAHTSASSVQAHDKMNIMKLWHVYLLLCDQKTFYVGISDDPKGRLADHRARRSLHTKKFSDLRFVYCEQYSSKHEATLREKQLKGWSRAKKQMLIEGKLGYNTCIELVEALNQKRDGSS